MKRVSFLIVCVSAFFVAKSQSADATVKKVKPFNAYITTIDSKNIKATLRGINDSMLLVTTSQGSQWQIPAENIQSFSMRRKNSVGKGALIGFGIGAATGIITGLAKGDDPVDNAPGFVSSSDFSDAFTSTAGGKAFVGGIGMGIGGAIIGGMIAALLEKKFTIGGKREAFRDLQSEIMNKLVRK